MTAVQSSPAAEIDQDKVMGFVMRAIDEVGATLNTALVVMGDKLGYYRALADLGPATADELAERTDTDAHYSREWLAAQAAGGYVTYDPATQLFTLPAEHAIALTDEESPAFLPGFSIAGFWLALWAAITVSIVSWIGSVLFKKD